MSDPPQEPPSSANLNRNSTSSFVVRQNWWQHLVAVWRRISRSNRILFLLNILIILAQLSAAIVVLVLYWSQPCDRQLQIFLLLYTVRVALVAPFALYHHLRRAALDVSEIPTAHWTERIRSTLDFYGMVLFFFGNYMLITSVDCHRTSPGVYYLSLVFIVLGYMILVVPLLLCGAVIFCLPCLLVGMRLAGVGRGHMAMRGASDADIAKLERVQYIQKTSCDAASKRFSQRISLTRPVDTPAKQAMECVSFDDPQDALCSICLDLYSDKEILRRLPCRHMFHEGCVDEWLRLNASCPLCKKVIGEQGEQSEGAIP